MGGHEFCCDCDICRKGTIWDIDDARESSRDDLTRFDMNRRKKTAATETQKSTQTQTETEPHADFCFCQSCMK